LSVEQQRTGVGKVEDNATFDVAGWWHDDELVPCPRCGNKQLTPSSPSMAGMRVCLTCGLIGEPDQAQ
jgi:hypothetical protein